MAIRQVATAGMISDTSLYNIDGACVVGGAVPIEVGRAVSVTTAEPVDGHKVVERTNTAPYGVVVRSHYETPDGTARVNEAVNVLTHGRIWMIAAEAVTPVFGQVVSIASDGSVGTTGTATAWKYAGGVIEAAANPDGYKLVEVQVLQSSTAVA